MRAFGWNHNQTVKYPIATFSMMDRLAGLRVRSHR
jgi:hypothetical protein